jgi:pimeloyl-ACP methyl ester carboxylesterase
MIHAIPGMGADHRMFPSPWDTLPDFIAHDWPPHQDERTLSDVAARLCREYTIRDGDVVVGTSLGGMVACEIAKIRRLEGLYLVGSATRREEVNRWLAAIRPLANLAPIEWIRMTAGRMPSDLARMFSEAEPSFVRRMCQAIFDWEGCDANSVQCVRIHGRHDLVIPPPPQVDLLLDGGHLVAMTHAQACVDYVRSTSGL